MNQSISENQSSTKKEDEFENKEIDSLKPEVLEGLPDEAKKIIEIAMTSMHRVGPPVNPISKIINAQHIDKILELAEKDDDRSFNDAKESRKYTLYYVLIFAALFVFATVYLVGSDKELYKEIIKLFSVFVGGLGGGFGIKSYIDRNKKP